MKEQIGAETTQSEDSTVKKKKKKVVKKKKKKEEKKELKAPEIASFLKNFVSTFCPLNFRFCKLRSHKLPTKDVQDFYLGRVK